MEKKIIITQVKSDVEVNKLLVEFNESFIPHLDKRVLDLKSHAKKIVRKGYVYIATNDSEAIGFIAFYANDDASNIGYLTHIAVKQNFINKGFGYELIKHFEKISFEKGMKTLKLEVLNDNSHAINFYIRNGYKRFRKATEVSVYMIKNLSSSL